MRSPSESRQQTPPSVVGGGLDATSAELDRFADLLAHLLAERWRRQQPKDPSCSQDRETASSGGT